MSAQREYELASAQREYELASAQREHELASAQREYEMPNVSVKPGRGRTGSELPRPVLREPR